MGSLKPQRTQEHSLKPQDHNQGLFRSDILEIIPSIIRKLVQHSLLKAIYIKQIF